jgi:hypothetical protein
VRGSTAVLGGSVQPHGLSTNYFFQYGPTVAYGSQTASATLPAGYTRVKVGDTVVGLRVGEHFRLVATNAAGTSFGRDHTYVIKQNVLRFAVPKEKNAPPTPYGGTYVLRGALTGTGSAGHQVVLQASPFPYLDPFFPVTAPTATSAAGGFVLRATHLTANTQIRVATLDPLPVLSPVITVHVSVRVTLKVRASGRRGLYRLYGTITPAQVGARVAFQLLKAIRPNRSERETTFATRFVTKSKRGTRAMSRFSLIVSVRNAGYYRAYVQLHAGRLSSGASPTVHLRAAASVKPRRKR